MANELSLLGAGLSGRVASPIGPNSPGTLADDSSAGTIAWSNPTNAAASDDVYAASTCSSGERSHYLNAQNFGFNVPNGATITDIKVEAEGNVSAALTTTLSAYIIKGGVVQSGAGVGAATPDVTDTVMNMSPADALWLVSWTPADINASDFGCALYWTCPSRGATRTISIDHIKITVSFS